MKWIVAIAVLLTFSLPAHSQRTLSAQSTGSHSASYQSAQRKLKEISENGQLAPAAAENHGADRRRNRRLPCGGRR